MDEAELNRLAAIAEQNLEDRITALREELEKKHQDEIIMTAFGGSSATGSLSVASHGIQRCHRGTAAVVARIERA